MNSPIRLFGFKGNKKSNGFLFSPDGSGITSFGTGYSEQQEHGLPINPEPFAPINAPDLDCRFLSFRLLNELLYEHT